MIFATDEWDDIVLNELVSILHNDAYYQQLLSECTQLEPGYKAVLKKLDIAEQELLERYISNCENLEYRKAQLAYQLGKQRLIESHSSTLP